MNRRERKEFARIERALLSSDPALSVMLTSRPMALVPFRIAREAFLSGVFVGSMPLAVEAKFLPLAAVAVALAFWSSCRWVNLMRIAYRSDDDAPPRLSPLVASVALFVAGAAVTLLGVVMLPW